MNASGGRKSKLLKISTNRNNRARTYGTRNMPKSVVLANSPNARDPFFGPWSGFNRSQTDSGTIDKVGRHAVARAQIFHASASPVVGKWNFQARQWRPPKIVPPKRAPKTKYIMSSFCPRGFIQGDSGVKGLASLGIGAGPNSGSNVGAGRLISAPFPTLAWVKR